MDHQSDDELVRETARRFLREHYAFRPNRMSAPLDSEDSRRRWRAFADLGWLGLAFPESEGGLGVGPAGITALMEEFGRALVLESYIGGALLAGYAILKSGDPSQRAELLGSLIEGRERFALAHQESSWRVGDLASVAMPIHGGWRLSARKSFILGGAVADFFIVSARTDGGQELFVVPRQADGVERRIFRTIDAGFAADLELHGVDVGTEAWLGRGATTDAAMAETAAHARAAACADAVGAMSALLDATVAYTQTRRQFAQPIAKFQALQHRMARMAILCEESRTAALYAASRTAAPPVARDRAVSGAKAKIGGAARWVAQQAVQLHGGIGMSSELAVGWHAKRLLMFENLLGTTREHLNIYAGLLRNTRIGVQDVLTTDESFQ
jgi:alkylation response protein AidB-like acyl-CoA dehydrogenase